MAREKGNTYVRGAKKENKKAAEALAEKENSAGAPRGGGVAQAGAGSGPDAGPNAARDAARNSGRERGPEQGAEAGGVVSPELLGLLLILCASLLGISLFSHHPSDPSLNHAVLGAVKVQNWAGMFGSYLSALLADLLGFSSYVPFALLLVAGARSCMRAAPLPWWRWAGYLPLTLCLALASTAWGLGLGEIRGGGLTGLAIYDVCLNFFNPIGTGVLWGFIFLLTVQLLFGFSWIQLIRKAGRSASEAFAENEEARKSAASAPPAQAGLELAQAGLGQAQAGPGRKQGGPARGREAGTGAEAGLGPGIAPAPDAPGRSGGMKSGSSETIRLAEARKKAGGFADDDELPPIMRLFEQGGAAPQSEAHQPEAPWPAAPRADAPGLPAGPEQPEWRQLERPRPFPEFFDPSGAAAARAAQAAASPARQAPAVERGPAAQAPQAPAQAYGRMEELIQRPAAVLERPDPAQARPAGPGSAAPAQPQPGGAGFYQEQAPGQIPIQSPGQAGSYQPGPGGSGPDRFAPAQSGQAGAYPEQSYPAQNYSGQTYPDAGHPDQTPLGQTYAGQAQPATGNAMSVTAPDGSPQMVSIRPEDYLPDEAPVVEQGPRYREEDPILDAARSFSEGQGRGHGLEADDSIWEKAARPFEQAQRPGAPRAPRADSDTLLAMREMMFGASDAPHSPGQADARPVRTVDIAPDSADFFQDLPPLPGRPARSGSAQTDSAASASARAKLLPPSVQPSGERPAKLQEQRPMPGQPLKPRPEHTPGQAHGQAQGLNQPGGQNQRSAPGRGVPGAVPGTMPGAVPGAAARPVAAPGPVAGPAPRTVPGAMPGSMPGPALGQPVGQPVSQAPGQPLGQPRPQPGQPQAGARPPLPDQPGGPVKLQEQRPMPGQPLKPRSQDAAPQNLSQGPAQAARPLQPQPGQPQQARPAAPGQGVPAQAVPPASSGPLAQARPPMGQAAPGRMAPGQVAPGQMVSGQQLPGQAPTAQAVPGQPGQQRQAPPLGGPAAPARPVQQPAPGQQIPGQSAPGQSFSGQGAPARPQVPAQPGNPFAPRQHQLDDLARQADRKLGAQAAHPLPGQPQGQPPVQSQGQTYGQQPARPAGGQPMPQPGPQFGQAPAQMTGQPRAQMQGRPQGQMQGQPHGQTQGQPPLAQPIQPPIQQPMPQPGPQPMPQSMQQPAQQFGPAPAQFQAPQLAPQAPQQPVQPPQPAPQARPQRIPAKLPPLDLLTSLEDNSPGVSKDELVAKGHALMACLKNFSVQAELVRITPGPIVTSFEVRPAPGVRSSKISGLSDDLALSLKAVSVRVQAPIPGTDTVGIEIPNETREIVSLHELIASPDFQKADQLLTMALGKDIDGMPHVADLSRMPHLLVAGATGTGKSVFLNSVLLSFLYKARPEELNLLLIDPKRIEMAVYADLPHLVHPIVTEMALAKNALEWAVAEMDRRYTDMARLSVRNVLSYNQRLKELGQNRPPNLADLEPLPYLVLIIDELADLMLTAGKDVETSIVRLAQLARAAGIHLIIATQRPSVDVVTGLIKANFPCRISFQVTSKHDSRTILDTVGAEHLLGRGDMLYKPAGGKLKRLHGAFVPDDDVGVVVDYWRKQQAPQYKVDFAEWGDQKEESSAAESFQADNSEEQLYSEIVAFVREQNKASISLIQRRFRLGFNRAARYIEQMEEDGIIGPADGSKPRQVR